MSGPVRSIAVVGSGAAACTAALALARAYRALGVAVTLVDTGRPISPHAAHAAAPDIRAFHRLLGIDEKALLSAGATLTLGQQFVGWSGNGSAFLHAYGDAGRPFASLPFVQHWTRARLAGLRVALEDFCLAAAAAKHGRIRVTGDGGAPMAYGYHLDATRYARLLRRHTETDGVTLRHDPAPCAVVEDGRVAAIRLSSGDLVEADLFVDAEGVLIDALDPAGPHAEDRHCDRLIRASAPALDPLPLYARVAAHSAGYVTLLPLADRTAVEFAYAGDRMSDSEAVSLLPSAAGLPILGHDAPEAIAPHEAARWVSNCVAIGSASDPSLDASALLGLQLAVGQLVLLLPVDRMDMDTEAAIYTAEASGQAERIAEFTAMHFHLNGRDEPFWTAARAAPVSDELAAKVALFGARGMFAHFDHEAHTVDSWALCMTGHGHLATGYDPQADRVDEREAMAAFQGQLHTIAREVRAMPTHAAALARLAGIRA